MDIFKKFQKANVYYDIDNIYNGINQEKYLPKGFFNNVKVYQNEKKLGCPAVSHLNKRIYCIYPSLSIDIEIFKNKETNLYEYKFVYTKAPTNKFLIEALQGMISINNLNEVVNLQIGLPYVFYTDSKDTELLTMPPDIYTENVKFVTGAFNIDKWIRALNLAYVLQDNSKKGIIKIDVKKPMMYLVFNKNVDISYKEFNSKTLNYYFQIKSITAFRDNLKSYYKDIISRKPKKFK